MTVLLAETLVIFALIGVNGLFAMTEIAVVSSRKSRLKSLAEAGDARARGALDLAESPNRFLSTVQIGITLMGVLAGAFGGAALAEDIAGQFGHVPWLGRHAEGVAFVIVVLGISYFSLVLGELVPKRLALIAPERIAMASAGPMRRLSILAKPAVAALSASTDALLKILHAKPAEAEAAVTEEEVKVLVREGLRGGALNRAETEMVESVLELDQLEVREIMTPRPKITWLSRDDSHETVWQKIVASDYSNFPVYEGNRDHVVGIVSVKAIYANLAAGVPVRLADLMTRPLIVPATQNCIQALETFKRTGKHIALVADEFGAILGLITLHDVMEAIVGDFPSQDERMKPRALRRDDGSILVDAMMEIESLIAVLPDVRFADEDGRDYQTLAGYVVKELGHVPTEGEKLVRQGHVFEIVDMDRHRVDKVLVRQAAQGRAG
ncbi:MAG: HlyC/CorC family transporter [Verrucomicrobiae bacterium]|nr:HlyC/CorC family transporter [Verrucomicrobiae bacterium]